MALRPLIRHEHPSKFLLPPTKRKLLGGNLLRVTEPGAWDDESRGRRFWVELVSYDLPAVPLPEDLVTHKKRLDKLRQELTQEEERLEKKIREFQEACSHQREGRVMLGEQYDRNTQLIYHECLDCGRKRPRRPGRYDEICNQCDGQLRLDAIIPGQGERTRVYVCEDCGHIKHFT